MTPYKDGSPSSRIQHPTLKQQALRGTVSPVDRLSSSRNQWIQVEMAPLTIIPRGPLGEYVSSVPIALESVGIELLVLRGEMLHQGTQQESY